MKKCLTYVGYAPSVKGFKVLYGVAVRSEKIRTYMVALSGGHFRCKTFKIYAICGIMGCKLTQYVVV